MQSPTCANCSFFRSTPTDDYGTCRVAPPVASPGGYATWPRVAHWEMCSGHPNAPRTREHDLLALIAHRLESADERQRSMRVAPDRPF